jgi:hypothetical protein
MIFTICHEFSLWLATFLGHDDQEMLLNMTACHVDSALTTVCCRAAFATAFNTSSSKHAAAEIQDFHNLQEEEPATPSIQLKVSESHIPRSSENRSSIRAAIWGLFHKTVELVRIENWGIEAHADWSVLNFNQWVRAQFFNSQQLNSFMNTPMFSSAAKSNLEA